MIISGIEAADDIYQDLKKKIASFKRKPALTMILVGSHAPSLSYVKMKKKASESVGIISKVIELSHETSENNLLRTIEEQNQDPLVDGILLQSPLPSHLKTETCFAAIAPEKDVDGFHPINMGKLLLGYHDGFVPCTPLGVLELLTKSKTQLEGAHAVIVGRSNIVGKPLSALLLQKNATISIVHSKTKDVGKITREADILIAALGKPHFIRADMVKEGSVVIDVGINRVEGKILGDVAFDEVLPKVAAITPVPKGVGPMTVAFLLKNTVLSYERRCAF